MVDEPAGLQAELFGDYRANEYVLFLDLWGTTARLKKGHLPEHQRLIALSHTYFISTLGVAAQQFPSIEVYQMSDGAFAYTTDFAALATFAMAVMKCMTYAHGSDLYPVRGAIGVGTHRFVNRGSFNHQNNFRYSPVIGWGNVEAGLLEKVGKKGMRLFVSDTAFKASGGLSGFTHRSQTLSVKNRIGLCLIDRLRRGVANLHYEINWTKPDSHYTPASAGYQDFSAALNRHRLRWARSSNAYECKLAKSLNELSAWK